MPTQTDDDSQLGPLVPGSPAIVPAVTTMGGRLVSLTGLDPGSHMDALYEGSHGDKADEVWRYLWEGPFVDRAAFRAALVQKASATDRVYFAILDRQSGKAVGYASYMRIEPAHRVIEVGDILYTRPFQRTSGATEAMYLMARHVFESLGYRRYEWKCHAANTPSRRAALRLGFRFEGIFRQHLIIKGRSRDTAWFSMLDAEWPRCQCAFEEWLDPSNFDADGVQRRSLAAIRDPSRG